MTISQKKFELAKETARYEYIRVMEKTNCIDKQYGHSYRWVSFEDKHLDEEIRKQFPSFHKGVAIVQCTKCGKVKQSM